MPGARQSLVSCTSLLGNTDTNNIRQKVEVMLVQEVSKILSKFKEEEDKVENLLKQM